MNRLTPLRRIVSTIAILLALQLAASTTLLWLVHEKRQDSRDRRERIAKALKDLDDERQKVFKDYAEALDSYETKSVMHQMYHAANANLRLQNVSTQQQHLSILLSAEE